MSTASDKVDQIFWDALQLDSEEDRSAYLDRACGGEPELRHLVERLLRAQPKAAAFLEQPFAGPPATADEPIGEAPGALIGPYKLIEQIGEGGMGTVWMAQQTEPVKRVVAVKLIKAGMDSRQVIARFEAERQALALMDHPNIARVLEAGTTNAGRPYFVMDLVKGVPITRYCDEHHLTPRQRLELFIPVCQAVQHAHQKGIIHRDIKPSNVLVALYDGKPVPKVIDFGVAKAAGQQLTEQTLVTGFGAIVGTLEYMSPEQAEINQLDIDTRSDIYSLGVLLYELLTGSPPFSRKELEKAGMLEMLRVIREQEPTKPSTKLSTADSLPTLAANRGTEPAKLTKLVRGELDWIVMKALEKDRNRRYETAGGFAMDVQRYLADEAVLACPPSTFYRLKKFVRRNRGPVIAVSVILLCLVAGIIGTSAGLDWAVRERNDKAQALIAETKARDRAMTALRVMTDEIVENQMARGTQLTEQNMEFLRKIIEHFEGFAAITTNDAESRAIRAEGYQRVGLMRHRLGELKEAEAAYAEAHAVWKQLAADFPTRPEFRQELAATHNNLGRLLRDTGRMREAEATYVEALALKKRLAADFPTRPEFRQQLAHSHHNMGLLFRATGRMREAEAAYTEALALQKRLAADFPTRAEFLQELATGQNNLGLLLGATGRMREAEAAYTEALALQKRLAADFPSRPEFFQELARSHHNVGNLFRATSRLKEAEAASAQALALQKRLAADFPTRPEFRQELATGHNNLGILLTETGRLTEAEAAFDAALALQKQLVAGFPTRPEFRQELARSHHSLGVLLKKMGRLTEAETANLAALALQKRLAADFPTRPEFRQELGMSHHNMGALFRVTGRMKEAEAAYAEALALRKQLAADFPNQPDLRNNLAGTAVNLALLRLKQGDFWGSKAHLEEAMPHHGSALKANPRHPDYRRVYRSNLTWLIQTDAGLGEHTGARQAAEKMRDLGWYPPNDAYEAACALSLCIPIVQSDNQATKEALDKQAAFYGDEAMKMLRLAVAKGYHDAAQIEKDSDLDPLRKREDFKKLLAELKAKSK